MKPQIRMIERHGSRYWAVITDSGAIPFSHDGGWHCALLSIVNGWWRTYPYSVWPLSDFRFVSEAALA